ncbi:MAG TPA: hypothetical protein VEV87_01720, partial [Chitinophagaceae bacterium]|nr:hypothetical protein [Chitinophagaceae bacterium]
MNSRKRLLLPCMILVCLSPVSVYAQAIPYFQAEEWSGTATLTYTVRGAKFFSEQKFTATISKGIGTAKSSSRFSVQRSDKSEKGSAQGEGPSSLEIGFNDDPPTYSIHIPVPAALGTQTVTYNSGSETSPYGEEESAIMISDQKLPKNTDVLSGKIEESGSGNDQQTLLVITWNFYRGASNVELIVLPKHYDTWLPSPGKDENTPGSKMSIYL